MNDWLKNAIGLSFGGLLIILAGNTKALIEGLLASWLFLLKLVDTAPMGLASFALALALAVSGQAFVQRILPRVNRAQMRQREASISLLGLAIAFAVMFVQLRTTYGALLGLLAGFAAPVAYQAVEGLLALLRRKVRP